MHAELKVKLYPYRWIDVHTDEGCFSVVYQRRIPNSQYVSVQGKTVVQAKDGSGGEFAFAVGSLPATLQVRPTLFGRLDALTLMVDDQVIYSENWLKLLLPGDSLGFVLMCFWYLGIYCCIGLVLKLLLRGCRWTLDFLLGFQLDLSAALDVVIPLVLFLWLATVILMIKGTNRVGPDLLIKKVEDLDELELGRLSKDWEQFISLMVEGDEIWEWESPELSWRLMAGRLGYVIVHNGHPTRHLLITGMS